MSAPDGAGLARRLGFSDAVVVGLGSMLGAGVFAAFAPAAAVAGSGLLISLALAGGVAYCNATASAQLAARYPEAGGTYVYGRRRLGPDLGFVAGWGFVVGKTASCAAMALTLGVYAWPDQAKPVAVAAVVGFAAVNYAGIAKTALLTRALVGLTSAALAVVVVGSIGGGRASASNLTGWAPEGALGLLRGAGLLFFAFAGYARIATLGEEVRQPQRTIPRAIPTALGMVLVVYAVVGAAALGAVGPDALARSEAPLATAVNAGSLHVLTPAVRIGGVVASAGVLLSLLAGVGRTTLAMARDHELPHALAAIHPHYRVPHRAEVLIALVVAVLVVALNLGDAIGFSSFAVLTYYGIANLSAFTLPGPQRRWLRPLSTAGVAGCAVLAATLPVSSVVTGVLVLVSGLAGRHIVRAASARRRRG